MSKSVKIEESKEDMKKLEEIKAQVEDLKHEYYARTTGSNWLKDSTLMKYMLE